MSIKIIIRIVHTQLKSSDSQGPYIEKLYYYYSYVSSSQVVSICEGLDGGSGIHYSLKI